MLCSAAERAFAAGCQTRKRVLADLWQELPTQLAAGAWYSSPEAVVDYLVALPTLP